MKNYLENEQNLSLPNFFILGAAKSGTTTVRNELKFHPEIFMSPVKEPTFFCEDFQVVKTEREYFDLFANAKDEKVIGEASHAYLSDPYSPVMLKKHFPEASFLVILRNPADRAYSLYNQRRLEVVGINPHQVPIFFAI